MVWLNIRYELPYYRTVFLIYINVFMKLYNNIYFTAFILILDEICVIFVNKLLKANIRLFL